MTTAFDVDNSRNRNLFFLFSLTMFYFQLGTGSNTIRGISGQVADDEKEGKNSQ